MSRVLSLDEVAPKHECPWCSIDTTTWSTLTPAERRQLRMQCDELRQIERAIASANRAQLRQRNRHPQRQAKMRSHANAALATAERIRAAMRVTLGLEDPREPDLDLWG